MHAKWNGITHFVTGISPASTPFPFNVLCSSKARIAVIVIYQCQFVGYSVDIFVR